MRKKRLTRGGKCGKLFSRTELGCNFFVWSFHYGNENGKSQNHF